jgi:UDP-glucuronate 4-epimerase
MPAPILVTGAAGFIGHAVAHRLLACGERVIGVDIINDYYDPALKEARLATFAGINSFAFERIDIADAAKMAALVRDNKIVRVVHLAAQAGVRYSIENPFAYERSNLAGHLSVMEACRYAEGFEHLIYASSSSVYGDKPMGGEGFKEDEPVLRQFIRLPANGPALLYGLWPLGTPRHGLFQLHAENPEGRGD